MTIRQRDACWISNATRTHCPACVRAQTHTHTHTLLLFHGNNGFVNASQCHVIRTLPSCFSLLTKFQNFTPTDGLCGSSHTGWISSSFGRLPLACPPYHARTSPTNTNTNANAHQQLVTDDLLYNITCTSSAPCPNKSLQLAFIMTSFVWLQSQSVSQPEIAILARPG
jgi:hypothetical protein